MEVRTASLSMDVEIDSLVNGPTPVNERDDNKYSFEKISQELVSPSTSLDTRCRLVTEIRERMDIVHSAEYKTLLQFLFPSLQALLTSIIPPSFAPDTQHKVQYINFFNDMSMRFTYFTPFSPTDSSSDP